MRERGKSASIYLVLEDKKGLDLVSPLQIAEKRREAKGKGEKERWLLLLLLLSHFSRVRLCATPETAAHQAPPSLGFSRQEHWSGLWVLRKKKKNKVKNIAMVQGRVISYCTDFVFITYFPHYINFGLDFI